jgi:hypothetical protein
MPPFDPSSAKPVAVFDPTSATPVSQAPAPRWDIMGDIGRSATASAGAVGSDFNSAFPDPLKMDLGPIASLKRMGSALKIPLDAAGVALSPLTGALHGTLGSAISYALPRIPQGKEAGFERASGIPADPKLAADSLIDQSMAMIAPRGMQDPLALSQVGAARKVTNLARTDAKLKNRAIERVNTRLQDDGITPQDVFTAQQQANANGDKVTLMDLGNKNTKGLAGAVYRAPGSAGREINQFLDARDAGSADALAGDIQGNVASGSTYHSTQDLLKARSQGARPAYDAAESVGPVHSDRLQNFLDQPEVQEGLRRGLKLERLNAVAENRPFVDSDYGITGYKDGNWDMPIFAKVPTVKSLIVANEGLGAKISEMVHPVTGRITKDGLALKKFRDAYQGEVDSLTGGKYKAARDQWSGPSQSMDAVREGREHFTRSESNEEIAADFNKLSEADKDFYRMGAAEAKVDAVEKAQDASDKSKRVINSERDRKRFRMLFRSDAEANNFINGVARKRAAFETKTAIKGGSQTAGRVADDMNENIPLGFEAVSGIGHAAAGNWLGAAHAAYRMKRDLGLRNNPALNSEIAKLLTDHSLPVHDLPRVLKSLPVPKRDGYLPPPIIPGGLFGTATPKK